MSDWVKLLDAGTPWAALPRIVDERTAVALDELRRQLDDDGDLSESERTELLADAEPLIRFKTRGVIEAAWTKVQLEAHDTVQ